MLHYRLFLTFGRVSYQYMKKEKRKYRFARPIVRTLLVLMLLFAGLVLFIRSPWGQNIIVSKITKAISDKTNTLVRIDRLYLTFSGNLFLEGLYMEDKKGDTLVYSKALEANLPLSPILFTNEINLRSLEWEGLRANIFRSEDPEKFNFSFLLEAFAPKDTAATTENKEPMKIDIGSMDFKDFRIEYVDRYLGVESSMDLGTLYLNASETDLESMRFELEDLELHDTEISYKQLKPLMASDTTETLLPYFAVNNLNIGNVKATYNSLPDDILATVGIGNFSLELSKADLANKDISIDLIDLKNSDITLKTGTIPPQPENAIPAAGISSDFQWPGFLIAVKKISFKNNTVNYRSGNSSSQIGEFNPNAIAVSNLDLEAGDITYQPKDAHIKIDKFSFAENSGFQLKELILEADLQDNAAAISGLKLETNGSYVIGELALKYESVQQLMDAPDMAGVDLQLSKIRLSVGDAFIFQPDLANNKYLKKASQQPLTGNFSGTGTLNAFKIPDMELYWGKNTSLTGQGRLNNTLDPDSLSFDFRTIRAVSTRSDVLRFVSEKDLGISIPQTLSLEGFVQGSPDRLNTDATLKIPEGTVRAKGNYSKKDQIQFEGQVQADSLLLDKLFKNEQLGAVSFTMDVSGSGNNMNTLNAALESDFSRLNLKDYDFSNLSLKGKITNGKGALHLSFKDENLNFTANTAIDLDSVASRINLDLRIIGSDLYALGITRENIKAGLKMKADFLGNAKDYELNALLTDGIAIYDNEQYQMGKVHLNSRIDTVSTVVSIDSDFLTGMLRSNTSPEGVNSALKEQFQNYFSDSLETGSVSDSVRLKMNMTLRPTPILTEVFFRGIQRLDSISVKADFDAAKKELSAELNTPSVTYEGSSIDSFKVIVNGNASDLNFTAGLAGLVAEPVNIKRTLIEGNLNNKELFLDFSAFDEEEKLLHIASKMTLSKDTVQLHINPEELVFNKKEWTIPKDNGISIAHKFLEFRNIKLSRNEQELTISNTVSGIKEEHIGILFDHFGLQTFLSLLNPDEALASGLIGGKLVIENPFEATGIVADFNINDLEVMQNSLGNLSLNATSKRKNEYDFNLALKEGGVDLDILGDYTAAETGALLNLDVVLNKLDLKIMEQFSEGAIKDSHGSISGNINVTGTTTAPKYEGAFNFSNVDFNVATLNSVFKISNEKVDIDTEGLYLDNFQIGDANGNAFVLDGSVLTEELLNPSFDLTLRAEEFLALDSTEADNELFYGKASLDADITVKGNLKLPKIEGKLRIRKITDITYIVPESQLDVEERDGVVIFVNREYPDAILTQNDQEETPALFGRMDLKAILEIADDAVFHIIIDKKTGDNLQVSGDGSLNLNIEPNGRMNLSGRYELNSGHYETSLYNLVKRRFEINPGGTITWQGDPMNAKLDVTAVYRVETSAAPLMSAVTSGQDVSVTGKYRQVLPFLVYLNVDGELLEPKLSFVLDMPEDEQGSLGGSVYGRVQQLNTQESELNKQVFSLLALNRFFPDSGSDGSAGGTAALARDNVNKVLSGELNAFSDRIFGKSGFELDFDLDSFTDYQGDSPQDRTQLNINARKKLFDDRLIVTAGSAVDVEGSAQPGQEETPIIGNVSLEYLLTKNGRYRLKGFRKNQYENIIDGQLIVTGVALIFNREFNRFSELFNPLADVEPEEANNKNNGDGKNTDGKKRQD